MKIIVKIIAKMMHGIPPDERHCVSPRARPLRPSAATRELFTRLILGSERGRVCVREDLESRMESQGWRVKDGESRMESQGWRVKDGESRMESQGTSTPRARNIRGTVEWL